MTDIRIVDWNMKWMRSLGSRGEYLKGILGDGTFVAILQEVEPRGYRELRGFVSGWAGIEYTLRDWTPDIPGGRGRRLGIAMLFSRDIEVGDAFSIPTSLLPGSTLLPERTLVADISVGGRPLTVMGLHSVAGCTYKMGKSHQYDVFSRAVETYRPDVIGIDANEPRFDGGSADEMTYYVQTGGGRGAERFFKTMRDEGLADSLVRHYDGTWIDDGFGHRCLAHSYTVKGGRRKRKVRYDFVYLRESSFVDWTCRYDYEGATGAGSDHASITVDATLD